MTAVHTRNEYDAIVVGSGMTGGWAAKELCEKGLKTLVLERGRSIEHIRDYVTEHKRPWELPLRGRVNQIEAETEYAVGKDVYLFSEATKQFFINDRENPYRADRPYRWIRGDQVGGRSLLWARQVYRWSDLDFEANLKDGHGVDWPIRYNDIAPWYDYVERFVGVSGQAEGLPQLPDGVFQKPMELTAMEKHARARISQAFPERLLTIGRSAVLTEPLNGRAACHYCGTCERGCSSASYFSSLSVTLPAAMRTGNLTLEADSLVHSLIYDSERDRVSGVRVVDKETGQMREVYGGVVFLCASALASTQVMLNSTSNRFPDGIANGSGELGHNLMDHHMGVHGYASSDDFADSYYEGVRPNGIYIPRWRNLDAASRTDEFVRGYAYQGSSYRDDWGRGMSQAGVGEAFKHGLRTPGRWHMVLWGYGECLPDHTNRVYLSSEEDQWGLPVLVMDADWGPNERAMRSEMASSAEEMLNACGFDDVSSEDYIDDNPQGFAIHEMGTARMGRDPRTSVLNGWNQAHEVPNLFVTDGACMTSSAVQNPSITYMALTARAVDHAVTALRRGDIRI
ncbi:MAG: GMC family oxidoreductase [Rhodothermales bacterium]|nr:GMC family oxidoreductase [Rhodothermales bacterium]MBO6778160.1 GMC family oxidoreductase [Rhodothermales bacterium]